MEKPSRYLSQSKQSQVFAVLKSAGVSNSDSWKLLLTSSKDGAPLMTVYTNSNEINSKVYWFYMYVCCFSFCEAPFFTPTFFFVLQIHLETDFGKAWMAHCCSTGARQIGHLSQFRCCIIWKQIAALNKMQFMQKLVFLKTIQVSRPEWFQGSLSSLLLTEFCFWKQHYQRHVEPVNDFHLSYKTRCVAIHAVQHSSSVISMQLQNSSPIYKKKRQTSRLDMKKMIVLLQ